MILEIYNPTVQLTHHAVDECDNGPRIIASYKGRRNVLSEALCEVFAAWWTAQEEKTHERP